MKSGSATLHQSITPQPAPLPSSPAAPGSSAAGNLNHCGSRFLVLKHHNSRRLGIHEWIKEHRISDRKDCCIGCDAERESSDCRYREHWCLQEHSGGVRQILQKCIHRLMGETYHRARLRKTAASTIELDVVPALSTHSGHQESPLLNKDPLLFYFATQSRFPGRER
jgi:hypothetical protein